MRRAAQDDVMEAIARLSSHTDGLTEGEVERYRKRFGRNTVDFEAAMPWWKHLWQCYRNPFNILLTVLAVLSALTGDLRATIIIGIMVLLSTFIRFVQENRSNQAAERLKNMVNTTASVLRRPPKNEVNTRKNSGFDLHLKSDVRHVELPIHDLVPGDHVVLSAGDMIPADCRVLTAKDLFVSQAAMTGEALPVEKFALLSQPFETVFDAANLVFMGTNVVSGTATALVVATGQHTYFGRLSERLGMRDRNPTAFEAGVNGVSWLLIRFALVMAPIVLLINGFTKGSWVEASVFALSVAVGLTPEMLPMIVTSTLARGAVALSRKKVIVKHLDAIQNFGAMDVLCTDKTGTLTQDRIALERHTDVFGGISNDVLRYAYLNSVHQTGLRNLLDDAVLQHVELQHDLLTAQGYQKIDEIPFDFERKRMSVVVEGRTGERTLICKGAFEEVLSVCEGVKLGAENESAALDEDMSERIRAAAADLNRQGLRVVAVAIRQARGGQSVFQVSDEAGLTLVGYMVFLDPPKESSAPALKALATHGVSVKVLTGDTELVALHVCREVGLEHCRYLLGVQIDKMNDGTLAHAVERHQLFARLTPAHKERIVGALRGNGHVVGFMGDGINDAPALRAADVGISVDTGVDIAKEAADIILLEKSLMVLEQGVLEGRRTFVNMLKYIRMTTSSNFGNVFSVLVGSAFLPFLPMLPLQLLVQNLLYDLSQVALPFDNVDDGLVSRPLKWDPRDIGRFMLFFGPLSSVFDIATYALLWWGLGAQDIAHQALFQSCWFVEGLLTQTLIVHMLRSPKLPFVQSTAALPLIVATLTIIVVGIALPLSPLAGSFGFEPLPKAFYPWLLLIILGYAALTTVMKRFYARRFGWV
ncbi:cation transport ATPase [Neokomagataea thailandica NBRC 106555]|nr:cation transport ATPase [Neokomagataea thailandica NBRC 106555]